MSTIFAEKDFETERYNDNMIRNPCKKQDCGCTLFCFFSAFAIMQVAFFYYYFRVAFLIDYKIEIDLIRK